jgi:hypothetical protein
VLVDDSEDDDCDRGKHGPGEEEKFPPFLFRCSGFGSVDVLARQQGVFFLDVAIRGVV